MEEAQEKTAQVLQDCYSKIAAYEPSEGSMYTWLLREAAALSLPEISLEPLRTVPKAEQILLAFARIGLSDFPEEHLESPLSVHLVQAVLSDLEEDHRLLLLSRYYRMDRESLFLICSDRSEGHEEELTQARYYFRRFLWAWLKKLHPSLPQRSEEIRVDLFERNLEKLFQSISPLLSLPLEKRRLLEESLLRQAEMKRLEAAVGQRGLRKLTWLGLAGTAVCLGLAVLGYYWKSASAQDGSVVVPVSADSEPKKGPEQPKEETGEDLKEVLNQVFAAGSSGDIPELLRILQVGSYPAQVAAAVFLGRLGGASEIGPLEAASRRWFSVPSEEDPFLMAIEQIEQRLRGTVPGLEVETEVVLLEPNQPPRQDSTEGLTEKQDEAASANQQAETSEEISEGFFLEEPLPDEPNLLLDEQEAPNVLEGENELNGTDELPADEEHAEGYQSGDIHYSPTDQEVSF
jgi:hypothetical protein